MLCETKPLTQSQIELHITVTPEEYRPFLERAARDISSQKPLAGFRPGHAPYKEVKILVGEMKIYEKALEYIVRKYYEQSVAEKQLKTVGMPSINVEKLAPDNDIIFKATVGLLPNVELPDFSAVKVSRKPQTVTDEEVNLVLEDVRKMRANEQIKNGATTQEDKVIVDMDMYHQGVAVEGGSAHDHAIYLADQYYIPGLQNELLGLSKGDKKTFSLSMPPQHYQKHLAGKTIEFRVAVKEVYERELPQLTDSFAKELGQDTMEELRTLIRSNLQEEKQTKEEQRLEIELLDRIVHMSQIEELPPVLVETEKERMLFELMQGVRRQGMEWADYLQNIKKTQQELLDNFTEQAQRRAKASLVSRAIALQQNITPGKEEIDAEIELISQRYQDDVQAQENLKKQEVRGSLETVLRNRKVIEWLKQNITLQE